MNNEFEINAEMREGRGKAESRRARHAGRIPAVLYGGAGESVTLMLDHNEIWTHLQREAFHSHILGIKVSGKKENAILRQVQYHTHKPKVLHVDFMRVVAGETVRMQVPLHFVGEEQAIGVKQQGGVISHLLSEVEVSCLPKDLPEFLSVDVSELELDGNIKLSDIDLPAGVSLAALELGLEHDQAVVSIHAARVAEVEEVADESTSEDGTQQQVPDADEVHDQ